MRATSLMLMLMLVSFTPTYGGEISASITGKVIGKTCYNQSIQEVACDGSQGQINRAFVAVEVNASLSHYAGVWCQRSLSNLGPCINGPNVGGFGFWSGEMLPQNLAPEPGGSGICATAVGCVFLSPF